MPKLCACSVSVPRGEILLSILFSPSGRQTSSSQWSLPSPETDCVVYCNIIILYYYIALLLDYTCLCCCRPTNSLFVHYSQCCGFTFTSRSNRVVRVHLIRYFTFCCSIYVQNGLDNTPFKSLNIQKQDVMCLACANFLVTTISTIT